MKRWKDDRGRKEKENGQEEKYRNAGQAEGVNLTPLCPQEGKAV